MAKRSSMLTISHDYETDQQKIQAAEGISGYNPILSLRLMNEVKVKAISPIIVKIWNASAVRINRKLDSIEKCRG